MPLAARLAPLFALAGICFASQAKLLFSGEYTWLDSPDLAYQVIPWLQMQAREWHAGRFPLWDPFQLGGQPLLGQMQPGVLNPFYWLLFLHAKFFAGGQLSFTALHWLKAVLHFAASLLAYLFCRQLGASRFGALTGGCLFGLAGFCGHIGWPQMFSSALWLPGTALFLHRAFRGQSHLLSSALAGLFLGLQFLGGHHNVPVFTLLFAACAWLFWLWQGPRELRRLAAPLLFFWVAFGIAAPQLLPARETGKDSLRWVGAAAPVSWQDRVPYQVHAQYSLQPEELPGLVVPQAAEQSPLFLGVAGFVLALFGLFHAPPRHAFWLSVLAVAALLFALGGSSLLHSLAYLVVPELHKARSPNMALSLFSLAAAALAAFGMDGFRSRGLSGRWLALASAVAFAFLAAMRLWPTAQNHLLPHYALFALALALMAAVGEAVRRHRLSPRWAGALVLGLLLTETNWSATYRYRPFSAPDSLLARTFAHADLAEFFARQSHAFQRPAAFHVADDALVPYNFGDLYGFRQSNGYLAALTTNVAGRFYEPEFQKLLGVNFLLAAQSPTGEPSLFAARRAPLQVFPLAGALPEFRTVHQAVQVAQAADVDRMVSHRELNTATTAVLLLPPPPLAECNQPDRISVLRNDPNEIELEVTMACDGLLLHGAVWTREWRATVDGQPAALYAAYDLIRGVPVRQGTHRVRLWYWPASFQRGLWFAAAAGLTLLGLTLLSRRAGNAAN